MEHAVVGERLRRRRDEPPGELHVRRRPGPRARPARSAPGLGIATSPGSIGPDPADRRHHPHRAGGDGRRRPDRLPDHPRHRGAGRDELPLPRPPRAVHGRERHPQPAQPAHPARRAGPRPADLVALPQRGRSSCSPTDTDVAVRLAPLADLGHASSVVRFLSEQRDLYAYLHDQTLRMLNSGATGIEIAEDIELPPGAGIGAGTPAATTARSATT